MLPAASQRMKTSLRPSAWTALGTPGLPYGLPPIFKPDCRQARGRGNFQSPGKDYQPRGTG